MEVSSINNTIYLIKSSAEHIEVHFYQEDAPHKWRPMVRTEEKRKEVHQQIVATLRILVHKLTQRISTLSCTSVYHMLKDLRLHPYDVQMRQELKVTNPTK